MKEYHLLLFYQDWVQTLLLWNIPFPLNMYIRIQTKFRNIIFIPALNFQARIKAVTLAGEISKSVNNASIPSGPILSSPDSFIFNVIICYRTYYHYHYVHTFIFLKECGGSISLLPLLCILIRILKKRAWYILFIINTPARVLDQPSQQKLPFS